MAKAIRRNDTVRLLGVARRKRTALMMSTALQATVVVVLSFPGMAAPAPNAQPTGGVVVGGQATIANTATTTTINQSTQRAAIDWQSFDVGSQQAVRFVQPTTSSIALNRVVGANPSQIAGRIDANGQIIIENQSGVIFYNGAQVNTNGLMVTAVGITNQNFMTGNMVFDQAANPNAQVVNQGTLTVHGAGLAALVAPSVANSGTIAAQLGNVVLAGAQAVTLDMYGDGLVSLNVTKQVMRAPDGAQALVTNTGVIKAKGGTVTLTAAAADGVVTKLVSAGGTISANSVGTKTGTVTIAGVGGNIEISGQLDAEGLGAGTTGGAIVANATGNVALTRTAHVNVSGKTGGGTVAIGTTLARAKGGPSVTAAQTAGSVSIAAGATIAANATDSGNGGRVTVLSKGTTTFAGSILARGGPNGGNGGFVETSGHTLKLPASAFVDTRAPLGKTGTWLLDPVNFTIATAAGDETPGQVVTALKASNVTIQADNDITVSNDIDASGEALATNNLIMQAGRNIAVNANIFLNGGSFIATANDSTDAGLAAANRGAGTGSFTMANGTTIGPGPAAGSVGDIVISVGASAAASGGGGAFTPGTIALGQLNVNGNVSVTGGTGLTMNDYIAAGGNVTLVSLGTINEAGAFAFVNAAALTGSSVGGASLTKNNQLTALGAFSDTGAGSAGINFAATADLATTGAISSTGGVTLSTSAGLNITLGANVTASGQTVSLTSGGTIGQTGGSITAGTLTGSSVGGATLSKANAIGTLAAFSDTTGSIAISNASALSVTGVVSAVTKASLTTTSGALTINGGSVVAPAVTLIGAGGIALTNSAVVGAAAATVDLSTAAGGLTEDASSSIVAGTLGSTGNIVGGATLTGSANAIDTLGAIAVTGGDFVLVDASQLNVSAKVTSDGNVFLRDTNATSRITIGATGSVGANASGLVSFQTDTLAIANAAKVSGGTLELAPNTAATAISLGSALDYLSSYFDITVSAARVGAVTYLGTLQAPTAGSITIDAPFGDVAVALDLRASGAITQLAGKTLSASVLSGAAGTVTLSESNAIGTLGNFTSTTNFTLGATGSLNVAGTVAAKNIALNAGTIGIAGFVNAGTTVSLGASDSGITETGSIAATSLGITAAKAVTLTGANAVGTIAGTISGSGQGFSFTDVGQSPTVDVVSGVTGITTNNGNVSLSATPSGDLTLNKTIAAGTGTLTLTAGGSLIQFTTGTVSAAAVTGSAGGSFFLNHQGNTIATLGVVTAATGISIASDTDLAVAAKLSDPVNVTVQSTNGKLTVLNTGTLAGAFVSLEANNQVSLAAGAVAGQASAIVELSSFAGNVVQVASSTIQAGSLYSQSGVFSGATLQGTANAIGSIGSIALGGGNFTLVNTGSIGIAGPLTGASTVAISSGTIGVTGSLTASTVIGLVAGNGGIAFNIGHIVGAPTIDLSGTGGGITQIGIGTISASTILQSTAGATGTVGLLGTTNTIAAIGSFAVAGGDFKVRTTGSLSVSGTVSAQNIALNTDTLGIAGLLNAGTTVSLGASAGGITETGSIAAATLTSMGTVAGGATLTTSTNTVAALGNFAVSGGNFSLTTTGSLNVSGTVSGPNVQLNAGTIGIAGFVNAGTTVSLGAGAGGITETGSIAAATLVGSSTGGATLASSTNTVAALGSFTVGSGDFSLTSTGSLNVAGTVGAKNIALTAGTLGIGGFLNAVTGVALGASAGGITESGSITATTLTSLGTIAGGATLTGTNTIGTLGSIAVSGGTLSVSSADNIAVAGRLSSDNDVVVLGTGAASGITVSGTVSGKSTTAGLVRIGGGSGGVSLANGHLLSAGTVDLFANKGSVSQPAATTGKIVTATLESSGSSTTGFAILGTLNTIGSTGNITLGKGAALKVADPGTINFAGSIAIDSGTLSIVSSGGPINLTGTVNLSTTGGASAGSLTLTAGGSISDGGTGFLNVGTLSISTTGAGNVSLTNANDKIGTINGASLSAGGLTVVVDPTLVLTGAQTATSFFYQVAVAGDGIQLGDGVTPATLTATGGGRISLIGDTFTQVAGGGANKLITTGVVEIAPLTNSVAMSIGGATNPVQIDSTLLTNISAGTLIAGSYLSGGTTITAASVLLDGNVSATSVGTLMIATLGSVHQSSGSVTATSLAINAGDAVDLTGANAVATIAATVTNASKGFTLNNTSTSLTVDAAAGLTGIATNKGSIALQTSSSGAITLNQNIGAGTGTVGLTSAGTIAQTGGSITAAGLGMTAADGIAVNGKNAVGTLAASVTTSGKGVKFTNDSTDLTVGAASGVTGIATNNGTVAVTTSTSGDLTIAQDISVGTGTIGLTSAGTVHQSGGVLTAVGLGVTAKNAVDLTLGNVVGTVAGTVSAAGQGFALNDTANSLQIGSAAGVTGITTNNGSIAVSTTTSGDLIVNQNVNAGTGTIGLTSAGTIDQPSGVLTAAGLGVASKGGVKLKQNNAIGTIAGTVSTSGQSFAFTDNATALTVDVASGLTGIATNGGAVSLTTGSSGDLTLNQNVSAGASSVTLNSAGAVGQTGGSIVATALRVSAANAVTLNGKNAVGTLAASVTGANQAFAFTNDATNLTIDNAAGLTGIATNNGNVALTTTTSGGQTINQNIGAGTGTITLASAGTISQTGGSLTAAALAGSAGGAVSLNDTNSIGALLAFGVSSGDFSLTDGGSLSVAGSIGAGNISLIAGTIGFASTGFANTTGVLSVGASAGGVSETAGSITAASLVSIGTVVGGATFTAKNTIGTLGNFNVSGGDLTFVSSGSATVTGVVAAPNVTLTAGTLTIPGTVTAATKLTLGANGGASGGVAASGNLNAGTLVGTSGNNGGVTLSGTNTILVLGSFDATGQTFFMKDSGSLSVAGPLTAANIALKAGTIDIAGQVSATAQVALGALSGGITESTGTVIAGTLTSNGTVTGGMTLNSGNDTIGSLGLITIATGNLAIMDTGSLAVVGPVNAPNVTLNAGTIGITGTLNAGTVLALGASSGGITESGSIGAATLASIGTVAGGATLTGTNTIASLGTFAVTGGGFTLIDTGSLSVGGVVSGPRIALSAGTLDIAGTINAGTLAALGASAGGVTESTGTVIAATLVSVGTIAGGMTLDGANNTIGALGSITLSSGALTIVSTGSLNVAGAVGAPNMLLSAATIGIGGFLNATTTVALAVSTGGITEAGSIAAGTLVSSGTITGGTTLNGTNTIATIGSLTYTGALVFDDTIAPTIAGIVGGGTATATSGSFAVPSLTIGSGGVLNVGSVTIATSAGGVAETGTGQIIASSISIATTGAGDVSLTNANNQIVASNGIQVGSGNLVLVDDPTLTLSGSFSGNNLFFQVTQAGDTIAIGAGSAATLTAAPSGGRISIVADKLTENAASTVTATSGTVEIAPFSTTVSMSLAGATQLLVDSTLLGKISTGTLTIGQYIDVNNGNAATTTAANISLDGAVSLTGVAGTLNLRTLGSIVEPTGPLSVAVLTGQAIGGATLAIATNNIGTLTGFGAAGLQLVDSTALVLAGKVTVGAAGTADISTTSGALTQGAGATLIAGTFTSNKGVAGVASLLGTKNQIGTITGFTALGGGLTVVDSNALTLAGVVSATSTGTVDITTSTGGLTQANTGTLIAGVLTSAGSLAGSASLLGTKNQIGTITGFTALGGGLTVVDSNALTLAGVVSATSTGTVDITTSTGGLTQANTGTLIAGVLTSAGSLAGSASLLGTKNQIGTITGFTALGGGLTVVDSNALTLAGVVSATSTGTVDITTSSGGVTQAAGGTLIAGVLTSAGSLAGSASLLGTKNQIGTITGFTALGGGLTVVDSNALTLAGVVSATSTGTVDITTSTGGVTQASSGTLIAGVLTSAGNIAGAASLKGDANKIGTISNLTAGGTLTVVDGMALVLANLVSVGNAGTVDISTSSGGITQATSGTLIAGTLTSTSGLAGTTSLQGTKNQIASVSTIKVAEPGTFTLNDSVDLQINTNGTLSAHEVAIADVGKIISLASGVVIQTDGVARPSGSILPANLPTSISNTNGGAYFAAGTFQQSGGLTVTALKGTESILRIDATDAIKLDATSGLNAPNTWLIFGLSNGASSTGAINVKALDVSYTGSLGAVSLTGSVNGLTGQAAASAANIEPSANANYKINACAISSVNCVLLPTQGVPQVSPITEIVFGSVFNPNSDDDDLLVPIVSDKDP